VRRRRRRSRRGMRLPDAVSGLRCGAHGARRRRRGLREWTGCESGQRALRPRAGHLRQDRRADRRQAHVPGRRVRALRARRAPR
jgi:hypothetical protein